MSEFVRASLVTASTVEPVTLAEAKLWLRIDTGETVEDDIVTALITTARQRFEDRHNRSCLQQTFDAVLDCAPYGLEPIRLPRSPVVSVSSVKGYSLTELTDTGGTAMSSSGYYVDTVSEPGRLVPTGEVAWPTATRNANSLIVRFIAGESTSSTGVQERAKTEIKQLVAKLFEHRGDELETAKVLLDYEQWPSDFSLPEWG